MAKGNPLLSKYIKMRKRKIWIEFRSRNSCAECGRFRGIFPHARVCLPQSPFYPTDKKGFVQKRTKPDTLRYTTHSAYAAFTVIHAPCNGGSRHSLPDRFCPSACSSGVIFDASLLVPAFHRRRVSVPFRPPYCLLHSFLRMGNIINMEIGKVKP